MAGLKETRLSRQFDQDRDGVFNAPVTNSSSGDDVREIPPIAWSDLTVDDSTPNSTQGKLYNEEGYGVGILAAGSDPNTLVTICMGAGQYRTIAPGQYIRSPNRFTRLFVKRSATLPLASNTFRLVVFQTKEATVEGFFGGGAANAGAANMAVTVDGATAPPFTPVAATPVNVCPARSSRWEVNIQNEGVADIFVGPSSAALSTTPPTGRRIAGGASLTLRTNAAVWAVEPTAAGSNVTATEVYS